MFMYVTKKNLKCIFSDWLTFSNTRGRLFVCHCMLQKSFFWVNQGFLFNAPLFILSVDDAITVTMQQVTHPMVLSSFPSFRWTQVLLLINHIFLSRQCQKGIKTLRSTRRIETSLCIIQIQNLFYTDTILNSRLLEIEKKNTLQAKKIKSQVHGLQRQNQTFSYDKQGCKTYLLILLSVYRRRHLRWGCRMSLFSFETWNTRWKAWSHSLGRGL